MASTLAEYYKSKGQALPSLSERSKLASSYGITGYAGTAEQNTKLLGILQGSGGGATQIGPSSPGYVQGTGNTVKSPVIGPSSPGYVQGTANTVKAPTTITAPAATKDQFQQQLDTFGTSLYQSRTDSNSPFQTDQQIADSVKSMVPTAPVAPNFTQTYTQLLADKGIPAIEKTVTDLQTEKQAIIDASKQRTAAEESKQVPLSLMAGRISEEQKQDQTRIDAIDAQINTASSQLTSAYKIVDTIMGLTEKDYQVASDQYKTQFDIAMKTFDAFRTIKKDQMDEAQQQQEVARANIQVYANLIKDGNFNISSLPLTTQVEINKLEVQSGLGVGFLNAVKKNAKATTDTIITHSDRIDANGKKVVDVIYQGKDGQPYVKTIDTGYDASSVKQDANAKINYLKQDLDAGATLDQVMNIYSGYIDPQEILNIYNSGSKYGPATETPEKLAKYGIKTPDPFAK